MYLSCIREEKKEKRRKVKNKKKSGRGRYSLHKTRDYISHADISSFR